MPNPNDWIIKDTQTGLFCTSYNSNLTYCGWGNENNAVTFDSEFAANAAITAWNETPGDRFIGTHPRPH